MTAFERLSKLGIQRMKSFLPWKGRLSVGPLFTMAIQKIMSDLIYTWHGKFY